MWNGMLYDVECLRTGWTTECEVVQNGVVKKSIWCEMVVWNCRVVWNIMVLFLMFCGMDIYSHE